MERSGINCKMCSLEMIFPIKKLKVIYLDWNWLSWMHKEINCNASVMESKPINTLCKTLKLSSWLRWWLKWVGSTKQRTALSHGVFANSWNKASSWETWPIPSPFAAVLVCVWNSYRWNVSLSASGSQRPGVFHYAGKETKPLKLRVLGSK